MNKTTRILCSIVINLQQPFVFMVEFEWPIVSMLVQQTWLDDLPQKPNVLLIFLQFFVC